MNEPSLDPKNVAALLGLTPGEAASLFADTQAEIDRERRDEMATVSEACDAAAARQWAVLGCRHGYRGPYWARWTAIQAVRSLSLNERLQELPPRGPRWLALWARNAGDLATFAEAYDYFLHLNDPTKIGPISHENSFYFANLYDRGDFQKICDTVTTFFSDCDDRPGTAGYLYEKVWLTFACVALHRDNTLDVAQKLTKQFPKEGGAWAALAVAQVGAGDTASALTAWERAIRCKYIEDDARRVALQHIEPHAK